MERGGEFGRRSEFRPEVGELGSEGQPERPVWAIPIHLLSWSSGIEPDIGPLLEDFGFKILDRGKTVEIPYGLFKARCYRVSPPSKAWRRSPDEDGKSCTIFSPTHKATFRVVYMISDELTGSFSYGVEII